MVDDLNLAQCDAGFPFIVHITKEPNLSKGSKKVHGSILHNLYIYYSKMSPVDLSFAPSVNYLRFL